jgi:predicted transcriptional regulator
LDPEWSEKRKNENIALEMEKAAKDNRIKLHKDTLFFDNLDDLMRSASKARLELFECILEKKPHSLYELAQMINKDQSYVLRESKALESMGLVRLTTVREGGREKSRPEALYDKIIIDVCFKDEPVAA